MGSAHPASAHRAGSGTVTPMTTSTPRDGVTVIRTPEATVRTLTRDAMLTERAELLEQAGMTEEQLRAAGAAWTLGAHLRGLLSRIDGLDFLLAHTPDPAAPGDGAR